MGKGIWHGYESITFEFEGRRADLIFPKKPDEKRNWTLKTEYKDAFPETEIDLLGEGFHVAYLENKSRFATKEDCDAKARFVKFLSREYGLRDKCVPVGMSCGGAHAVNFGGFYPELIQCMFVDAPVLNFLSYPGRIGKEDAVWENEFVKAYPGITRAKLFNFENHPMNKIDVLKAHKIPIIMLYGNEDQTVPYEENGKILELEYADSPELLKVVPRYNQGHHPHGLMYNNHIVIDFIKEHSN